MFKRLLLSAILCLVALGCATAPTSPLTKINLFSDLLASVPEARTKYYVFPGETLKLEYLRLSYWVQTERGIIVREMELNDAMGMTTFFRNERVIITIKSDMGYDSKFVTLVHEIGHFIAGVNVTEEVGDAFSEMLAVRTASKLGLTDYEKIGCSYLSNLPTRIRWEIARQLETEIEALSDLLVKASKGELYGRRIGMDLGDIPMDWAVHSPVGNRPHHAWGS